MFLLLIYEICIFSIILYYVKLMHSQLEKKNNELFIIIEKTP